MFTILFFFGCEPDVGVGHYPLQSCHEELLEATDYNEDEGIDGIVVIKKERKMYLYKAGEVQEIIPVSLGKHPLGQKEQEGDGKTPEGTFFIDRKLCSSKYYRSLCISYPRAKDKARARAKGLNPGGNITIHAQPTWNANGEADSYTLKHNWTHGCIAVTNSTMKKLWYAVHEGVPITIQ